MQWIHPINPLTISMNTTTPRVCSLCIKRVFTNTTFGNGWRILLIKFRSHFRYLASWASISSAAALGCVWCRLILSLRESGDDGKPLFLVEVRLRKDHGDAVERKQGEKARPKGVESLSVWIDGAPRASYYVYTTPVNPAAEYVTARSLVRELSNPSSVDMARASLQRCISNHLRCNIAHPVLPSPNQDHGHDPDMGKSARIAPTRLIDCGGDEESRIRIVLAGPSGSNATENQYIALSYVWGSPQTNNSQISACSTEANITSRMSDGMELHLLPATIRDAVTVTRGLGLRWLWIDAICILQDSPEDKTRELPKMQGIYRGAYITIIAANANGSNEGFLQVRERGYDAEDPEIPFTIEDTHQVTSGASIFLSPVWKQYDETKEPINSRAWCLQERLLSTRALVYASHTLQYRCITETVNIGDGLCAPISGPSGPDLAPLLCGSNEEDPLQASPTSPTQLRRLWNSVVEEYSWRHLTVSADKLIAIAAMADLVHLHFTNSSCRYLAGVWDYEESPNTLSLIRGFLWFKDYTNRLPRPREYRAPSWSWASVDGRVLLENIDDRVREGRVAPEEVETCCEVLECTTVLKDQRVQFGEVTNGKLRMNVTVVRVECELATELPDVKWGNKVVGVAFADTTEQINREKVWAMPLMCNHKAGYGEGLLITPTAGRGDECFRRVGYFHSSEESSVVVDWLGLFPRRDVCI
ncbi:heterokaryon incompatibility protein-domain-containing protein, partial [Collybia nuda]